MTQVTMIGNIINTIKLETISGYVFAKFNLRVEIGDRVEFIKCKVWDRQAERLAYYSVPGTYISVTGKLIDGYINCVSYQMLRENALRAGQVFS